MDSGLTELQIPTPLENLRGLTLSNLSTRLVEKLLASVITLLSPKWTFG